MFNRSLASSPTTGSSDIAPGITITSGWGDYWWFQSRIFRHESQTAPPRPRSLASPMLWRLCGSSGRSVVPQRTHRGLSNPSQHSSQSFTILPLDDRLKNVPLIRSAVSLQRSQFSCIVISPGIRLRFRSPFRSVPSARPLCRALFQPDQGSCRTPVLLGF